MNVPFIRVHNYPNNWSMHDIYMRITWLQNTPVLRLILFLNLLHFIMGWWQQETRKLEFTIRIEDQS